MNDGFDPSDGKQSWTLVQEQDEGSTHQQCEHCTKIPNVNTTRTLRQLDSAAIIINLTVDALGNFG